MLALWVILHHLTGPGMLLDAWVRTLPRAAAETIHNGYQAVGTFFVLSGFVLARGYAATPWNRRNLARYFAARLARIYPVYLLSIAVVGPFIAAERLPAGKGAFVAYYVLLLQGWTGRLPVGWNTPAWSLSCEVFFYLCFPLLAVLLGRRWLVAAAAALVLPTVLLAGGVPDMCKPIVHLADFVMGIAAAGICTRWSAARGDWLYVPALLLGIVVIAWPEVLGGAVAMNTALRPLDALLLVGLAMGGGPLAALFSTRLCVFLGQASYAMYILHVPLLWWYKRWMGARTGLHLGLVYVLLVMLISAAVFRWLEEPANRRLRNWVRART